MIGDLAENCSPNHWDHFHTWLGLIPQLSILHKINLVSSPKRKFDFFELYSAKLTIAKGFPPNKENGQKLVIIAIPETIQGSVSIINLPEKHM